MMTMSPAERRYQNLLEHRRGSSPLIGPSRRMAPSTRVTAERGQKGERPPVARAEPFAQPLPARTAPMSAQSYWSGPKVSSMKTDGAGSSLSCACFHRVAPPGRSQDGTARWRQAFFLKLTLHASEESSSRTPLVDDHNTGARQRLRQAAASAGFTPGSRPTAPGRQSRRQQEHTAAGHHRPEAAALPVAPKRNR